jgi:hypothetical protein
MSESSEFFAEGGCTCRAIRYRLRGAPMLVHCCHCRWCQRETGTAFALNAVIESDRVQLQGGQPDRIRTPSLSGKGQIIVRCPVCRVAVWSHYAGSGEATSFIRVGTLDDPDRCPPQVHIFTSSKQPWVHLPAGVPAFTEIYDPKTFWSAEVMSRWQGARQAGKI